METIFPASGASDIVVRDQVTSCPTAVLGDQTVVVKWSWISRAAHNVKAEQSPPKILRRIYCHEEIDKLIPACYEPVLGNLPDVVGGCERRPLRIIAQEELQSITKLTDPQELAVAFKGLIECHHWLYETAKILHRDISLSNLMFQRIDDKLYGVLSDFDLTNPYGRNKSSVSKLHSGTGAYTAMDLLVRGPPEHQYRHDLESFLYVLVFLTCEIKGSDLANWDNLGMDGLRRDKTEAINATGFPPQTHEFAIFYGWVGRLRALFQEGLANRNRHQNIFISRGAAFDDLTLGGKVTGDKFDAVLDLRNLQTEEEVNEMYYARIAKRTDAELDHTVLGPII
ncbi:hypothetical protein DFH06DRAFT_1316189 [Mycena polygramma]|nr:hypothetical protein DFH06DRAFT_1316189 [Mycena polygramma]